jgi:hypothetical protein
MPGDMSRIIAEGGFVSEVSAVFLFRERMSDGCVIVKYSSRMFPLFVKLI